MKEKRKRSSYTLEYKLQAVRLVQIGQSCSATAKQLGIPQKTLDNWVRQAATGKLTVGIEISVSVDQNEQFTPEVKEYQPESQILCPVVSLPPQAVSNLPKEIDSGKVKAVSALAPIPRLGHYGWNLFFLLTAILLLVANIIFSGHLISPDKLYKPGDEVGYNIGLVGGLMLLTMLLYPLRKRFSFMRKLSNLPRWFRWHMILGILGPTLIMFHSTFVIHSINAGVAMTCMILVSGSGIFGRFFYSKIHHGLYGRHSNLMEMREEMTKAGGINDSLMKLAPQIEQRIGQYHDQVEKMKSDFRSFLSIGFQATLLTRSLQKELHTLMFSQDHEKTTGEAMKQEITDRYEEFAQHIRLSIKTARDVAQFSAYERLFSWWHILHIPLIYMMVFSGIYHVIAVHMY